MTPAQVDELSLWQMMAVIQGHIEANSKDGPPLPDLSEQEMDDLESWAASESL